MVVAVLVVFLARAITPEEAYREVEWRAVILIGCMLALGLLIAFLWWAWRKKEGLIARFIQANAGRLASRRPEDVVLLVPQSQILSVRDYGTEATRRAVRALYYHLHVPVRAVGEYQVAQTLGVERQQRERQGPHSDDQLQVFQEIARRNLNASVGGVAERRGRELVGVLGLS